MKLKYYLRGLGIGIILTTIILMIASSGEKSTMTDKEIIERAHALGMVMAENETKDAENEPDDAQEELSDTQEEPNDAQEDGDSTEEGSPQDNEIEDAQSTEPENTQSTEPEDDEAENTQSTEPEDNEAENTQSTEPEDNEVENTQSAEPEDNEAEAAQSAAQEDETVYVMIEVVGGEFSDKISTKLYEAGLVPDAKEFNQYLVKNGIDNKIAVGQHQIPQGATIEEIAEILCKKPKSRKADK